MLAVSFKSRGPKLLFSKLLRYLSFNFINVALNPFFPYSLSLAVLFFFIVNNLCLHLGFFSTVETKKSTACFSLPPILSISCLLPHK